MQRPSLSNLSLALSTFAALALGGCADADVDGGPGDGMNAGSENEDEGGSTGGDSQSAADDDESEPTTGAPEATSEGGSSGGDEDPDGTSTGAEDPGGDESSGGESTDGDPTEPDPTDGGVMEYCEAPGELQSCDGDSSDPFHALGLGCPFGPNEAIPVYNSIFASDDPDAWRVATGFGTATDTEGQPVWQAREGEKFLMISSGRFRDADDDGVVLGTAGDHDGGVDNSNRNLRPLPAPMTAARGSNAGDGGTPFLACDGHGDCSDSLHEEWLQGGQDAHDLLWFQFDLDVPGGTHGFSFDFAYFSAEFPEFVGTSFNDVFAVWSDSETYTGNLCFVNDQPCTVSALWPIAHGPGDPALDGTGFEPSGATGWFQAKGSAAPGERLGLTFAIFDMGDTAYDTAVLLDNFRWDCAGCAASEVEPCVGIDPV